MADSIVADSIVADSPDTTIVLKSGAHVTKEGTRDGLQRLARLLPQLNGKGFTLQPSKSGRFARVVLFTIDKNGNPVNEEGTPLLNHVGVTAIPPAEPSLPSPPVLALGNGPSGGDSPSDNPSSSSPVLPAQLAQAMQP